MRVPALALPVRISVVVLAVGLAAPIPAQKSGQSATDFYLSYIAVAEKMKSLKDLQPFLPKQEAAMVAKMPKEMEKEFLEEALKERVTGVKVLKETPDKNAYLLDVEGTRKATGKKVKGWAKIIREDGAFKVGKEDWSGNPPPLRRKFRPVSRSRARRWAS